MQTVVFVLEIKPRFSEREVDTLNHWVAFITPNVPGIIRNKIIFQNYLHDNSIFGNIVRGLITFLNVRTNKVKGYNLIVKRNNKRNYGISTLISI